MRFSIILAITFILSACSQPEANQTPAAEAMPMAETTAPATNELSAILAAQPEAVQRDTFTATLKKPSTSLA